MNHSRHSLVLVGALDRDPLKCVQEAVASVGIPMQPIRDPLEAPLALADMAEPLAILLRMDAEGATDLLAHVRGQTHLERLPVFGIAPRRDDLAFTELFCWGGDDLVEPTSSASLVRRLRPLVLNPPRPMEPKREAPLALVAGADARWRGVVGRALKHGGFSVRFVDPDGIVQECRADGVRLVISADDPAGGCTESVLSAARSSGSRAAWVVVASPKHMPSLRAAIQSLGDASVADSFAPPENVLFLANELLSRRGVDQRASARVLYGTAVAFRESGREQDEIGFSYNVSGGGVYVRTLAPPEAGQEVWLEMWPPRSERRVRLMGSIAWKRPFGPSEGATVPAGFGVKITGGLGADLDRWQAGYRAFAESILGTRSAEG